MASSNVALAAIGIACVAAAGAGGYFALRQNATPTASPANAVVATTPSSAATAQPPAAEPPVQETEAVVKPAAKVAKPAAKPVPVKPEKAESARAVNSPTLNRTWPSSTAQAPLPSPAAPPEPIPAANPTQSVEHASEPPLPVVPPAPPQKTYE